MRLPAYDRAPEEAMTEAEMREILFAFPEVEEGASYGRPSFKANGKFLTRLRAEDQSLVIYVDSLDMREIMIEAEPETFHITPHYRNYPCVLARLSALDAETFRKFIDRRWRTLVKKATVKAYDAERSAEVTG